MMIHLERILMLVLCVTSLSGNTRPDFELGPNGRYCIQRTSGIHKHYYEHNDENGHHCLCQLCGHGYVLNKHCTCDPNNLEQPQVSECVLVSRGQFMNSSNCCSQGFECKKCPHPLKVRNTCSPHGPDAVCTCADGYYMTSPDTCLPVPRCDAGFQPVPGHGDHGTEIRCTQCLEGYFQPNNNSMLRCKRIRQCTRQEGTLRSDAVCLNDPTLQLKQLTNGYVTTETSTMTEDTETVKPVTTPAPTPGLNESTTNGSSTLPTPNNLHVVVDLLEAIFFNPVAGFLCGVICCNFKSVRSFLQSGCNLRKLWNFLRSFCQRGTYTLPEEPEEIKCPFVVMEGIAEERV